MHRRDHAPTLRRSAHGQTFRSRSRRSAVPPLTRVTGKRHVCQPNLADNFENVMVTYACIFTGPQAQIPSSPYQQGLGLVRGYVATRPAVDRDPKTRLRNAPACCPSVPFNMFKPLVNLLNVLRAAITESPTQLAVVDQRSCGRDAPPK